VTGKCRRIKASRRGAYWYQWTEMIGFRAEIDCNNLPSAYTTSKHNRCAMIHHQFCFICCRNGVGRTIRNFRVTYCA
jgi:hypothetical protein